MAIRVIDLLRPDLFRDKVCGVNLSVFNYLLVNLYKADPLSEDKIFDDNNEAMPNSSANSSPMSHC